MIKQFSKEQNKRSLPISVVMGLLVALVISLIGAFIGATLLDKELIGESALSLISMIVWLAGGFTGAMVSGVLSRSQYLLVIGITALLYLSIITAVSIILFDSQFCGLVQGIICLIIGCAVCLLIFTRKNGTQKHKVKYRIR